MQRRAREEREDGGELEARGEGDPSGGHAFERDVLEFISRFASETWHLPMKSFIERMSRSYTRTQRGSEPRSRR
jgi:hypothetical protein